MGDPAHVAVVRGGRAAIAAWRQANPTTILDLENEPFVRQDLRQADLRDARLLYSDLKGAWLVDANLRGADLRKSDLTGAWLMSADFTGADLRGARLDRADLSFANFTNAKLAAASTTGALTKGAISMKRLTGYLRGFSQRWKLSTHTPPILPSDSVPHVVLFETPVGFDHQNINLGDYQGLLFVESLSRSGGQTGLLLTVWRDDRSYNVASSRFANAHSLTAAVAPWQGFHVGIRYPKESFWKTWPYARTWAVVASFFLALGYVDTLQDRFGPPRVEPLASAAPVNVLLGDPVKLDAIVRNTAEVGHCNIEFLDHSATPIGGLKLAPISVQRVPDVHPDGRAVSPISGEAIQPGTYEVIMKCRATAGLFRRKIEFDVTNAVRVWQGLAVGRPQIKRVSGGAKLCEIDYELLPGRGYPKGIEVDVILERSPGVRFLGVRFPGTDSFTAHEASGSPGKEVATLRWRTREISPMRTVRFTLVVVTSDPRGKTTDEWDLVAQAIQCVPRDVPEDKKEIE